MIISFRARPNPCWQPAWLFTKMLKKSWNFRIFTKTRKKNSWIWKFTFEKLPMKEISGMNYTWGDLLYEFPVETRLTVYRRLDIYIMSYWFVTFRSFILYWRLILCDYQLPSSTKPLLTTELPLRQNVEKMMKFPKQNIFQFFKAKRFLFRKFKIFKFLKISFFWKCSCFQLC